MALVNTPLNTIVTNPREYQEQDVQRRLSSKEDPTVTLRRTRCFTSKQKRSSDSQGQPCARCVAAHIPLELRNLDRINHYAPFAKWRNPEYEMRFISVSGRVTVPEIEHLRHLPNGPILEVSCCPFEPTQDYQVRILWKEEVGWHSAQITAYCLANPTDDDLLSYIKKCSVSVVQMTCYTRHRIRAFFCYAIGLHEHPIVNQCLELYTTLVLLRSGWRFTGDATLGMSPIEDQRSAWRGKTPVPRMVQNQLCHQLELHMSKLDAKFVKALHQMLGRKNDSEWLIVTLITFMLLHILEIDAARKIYWKRYKDSGGFWIHPSNPADIIEEAVLSCNSLLWHYHCFHGRLLSRNWEMNPSNDKTFNNRTKWLQSYISEISEQHSHLINLSKEVFKRGFKHSIPIREVRPSGPPGVESVCGWKTRECNLYHQLFVVRAESG